MNLLPHWTTEASPCVCIRPQVSNNCYNFILVQYCRLPQLKHWILYLDTSYSPNSTADEHFWQLLLISQQFSQLLGRCIASGTWFSSRYIFYIYSTSFSRTVTRRSYPEHSFCLSTYCSSSTGGLVNNGAMLREMYIKIHKNNPIAALRIYPLPISVL